MLLVERLRRLARPLHRPRGLPPGEQAVLVAAAWATVCVGAAWFVFRRRDFAGSAPAASAPVARPVAGYASPSAAGVAVLAVAAGWGPPAVTASRLNAAIGPEFENLVVLQQHELGRAVPAGATLKLLSTCRRRGAATPYRGPRRLVLHAHRGRARTSGRCRSTTTSTCRPNGCFTAHGPPAVGGAVLRGRPGRRNAEPALCVRRLLRNLT